MGYWGYYDSYYKPYVSVAQRLSNAKKHATKAATKAGRSCSPVEIDGTQIARTFWGKGWCDHLESYSDISNRLGRGRTYVRNGSVVDLCIEPGKVQAVVAGTEVYEIDIEIKPLAKPRWDSIKARCAGQIGSMVELLQGKLSKGVMEIIASRDEGMFPAPKEISMDCSCPDGARMCKHLAAVLYGIGARFDDSPELLFTLRGVDHLELIAGAGDVSKIGTGPAKSGRKTLKSADLSDVFGIEIGGGAGGARPVEVVETKVAPANAPKVKRKKDPEPPGKIESAPKANRPGKVQAARKKKSV
jgi:uncharacterized Zn finger protein